MLQQIPTTFTLPRKNRKEQDEDALAIPLRLVPDATGNMVTATGLVQILAEADAPLAAFTLSTKTSPAPQELPPKHWQVLAEHSRKVGDLVVNDLPAGVFVWFDGLDHILDVYYAPDRREPGWTRGQRDLMAISETIWPDEATVSTLLEGFESYFDASVKHTAQQQNPTPKVSEKLWDPARLRELAEYREQHGTKKAAGKFNISEQRVRQLLPRKIPKKANFFPH